MPPVRILIADDHTLMRQGLRQICERLGAFTVDTHMGLIRARQPACFATSA